MEYSRDDVNNISSLSNDVLKQAEASLAAFIGGVNYSDQFASLPPSRAGLCRTLPDFDEGKKGRKPPSRTKPKSSSLFDSEKMADCIEHANTVAQTYGVTVISINVIGAVPADTTLQTTLAQGAVAAAEPTSSRQLPVAGGQRGVDRGQRTDAEILRSPGESESARIRARRGSTGTRKNQLPNQKWRCVSR
jgi:hypothetical protein